MKRLYEHIIRELSSDCEYFLRALESSGNNHIKLFIQEQLKQEKEGKEQEEWSD